LPVVRDSRLVGIVARANFMHALVSLATQPKASLGNDGAIRAQILAEREKQSWVPMSNVVIRNGVVELWGGITDERQRQARIVAAENVPRLGSRPCTITSSSLRLRPRVGAQLADRSRNRERRDGGGSVFKLRETPLESSPQQPRHRS
jgi:hypothetical protein